MFSTLCNLAIKGILFIYSVGFNAAASVRVCNELGAGKSKSAAFSVVMVTLVSLTIAVIEALVVLALKHVISYVFTSGETVANAVSELCPFLAVTLILGVRVSNKLGAGKPKSAAVSVVMVTLVSLTITVTEAIVALRHVISYVFTSSETVANAISELCQFLAVTLILSDQSCLGIWFGMIGGTVMQAIILLWTTYHTDWNKEVQVICLLASCIWCNEFSCGENVDKWEDVKQPLVRDSMAGHEEALNSASQ